MRDHCKLSFPQPPRSRVLARLISLTQIGELARRLDVYLYFTKQITFVKNGSKGTERKKKPVTHVSNVFRCPFIPF